MIEDDKVTRLAVLTSRNPHDFDPLTAFCNRCGGAMYDLFNNPRQCLEGDNVIAFAPAHSRKRLGHMIIPLLGRID